MSETDITLMKSAIDYPAVAKDTFHESALYEFTIVKLAGGQLACFQVYLVECLFGIMGLRSDLGTQGEDLRRINCMVLPGYLVVRSEIILALSLMSCLSEFRCQRDP